MAVTTNPMDTRLRLVFYVGDDIEGNPIEKTKSFSRVKPTADNQDLYDVAQSLASLQTYTLTQTERSERSALEEI